MQVPGGQQRFAEWITLGGGMARATVRNFLHGHWNGVISRSTHAPKRSWR